MAETGAKRRLAAIVAVDMVGYSRLMGADEEGTLAALKAHRAATDPIGTRHGGRIVGSAGDGLLVEFPSVVEAVNYAVETQSIMAERNADRPDDRKMLYRIGINLGDVLVDADGNIFGDGVNVAARLETLADAGGICISASVYDQIVGKLDIDFTDIGEPALKNIERPVRVYALASATDDAAKARQRQAGPAADGDGALDLSHFDRPSLVVMPFKDLGGGDQASLAEGLRLSLHSMLVKLSGLFLLHIDTVEGYREQKISAVEVGRDIDFRYVVEGAVQHSGDRVRISVQVTDAPAGQLILAERYDRVLDDIFDLEDEIAVEVVGTLDIELRSGEAGRAWWQGITDPAVRVYIHRGLSHLYKGTKDDNAAALRMYEKIDELQPDCPQCLGLIALTHWNDAQFGWSSDPDDSLEKAAALAERAVDPGDPDGIALAVIGHVRLYQRRHQEALEYCSEAITRRPS